MNNKDVEMAEQEKLKKNMDKDDPMKNATYSFNGEDHTLGNLVRNLLIKDPDTQFCGYSVPHPSEDIMNVRLQTFETPTDKVLNKALIRVSKMCEIMTDKFKNALNDFSIKKNNDS